MDDRYSDWLLANVPTESTWRTKLSELRRIIRAYGDLDEIHASDGLESVLSELEYSAIDERNEEPNPSKLDLTGNIRNQLSSYRSALRRYMRFLEAKEAGLLSGEKKPETDDLLENAMTFGLEKDMQTALRSNIGQLEKDLSIIDGGTERTVPSGRIDILARDTDGATVAIELKAVLAQRAVIGQILAYMSDLVDEFGEPVRGILIAPEFDAKTVSASKMVPTLKLVRYRYSFSFEDVDP